MKIFHTFLLLSLAIASSLCAQDLTPYSYDIGTPSVVDYYVDPVNGSDSANGTSIPSAWKTVSHAWNQIPQSAPLTQGYRINLLNGTFSGDDLPNYWENRIGTFAHPIILRANPGQTSVVFARDINMAHVSFFYLIGINITPQGGGDAFHCEACDHLLLRGCTLNGGSTTNGAHETLKVNQSQYIYIENNNIGYADDNNIDFVAVQYGHIIGNRIHDAQDWCMYVKGGSAYLRIESNELFSCDTGGFTAGQGSGFQFMTSPWIHYEAYDIKFINNIVHDTEGAAFGVNGGYNVLIAHNTAFKTGSRDHLIEVVFGERTCDGENQGSSNSTCAGYQSAGGWGADAVDLTPEPIGNRNVFVLNNVVVNPTEVIAPQHFAIYGPRNANAGTNLSSPQYSDINLDISGNLIFNGVGTATFGVEDAEQGCQPSNITCNLTQLQTDNIVNAIEPAFKDVSQNDFRPQAGGNLLSVVPSSLAAFPGSDRPTPPSSAAGELSNSFLRDFAGTVSSGARIVGAFESPDSANKPPAIDGIDTPTDPAAGLPTLGKLSVKMVRQRKKVSFAVACGVTSSAPLLSVTAEFVKGGNVVNSFELTLKNNKYRGSRKLKIGSGKRITVNVSAANSVGTGMKSRKVTAP